MEEERLRGLLAKCFALGTLIGLREGVEHCFHISVIALGLADWTDGYHLGPPESSREFPCVSDSAEKGTTTMLLADVEYSRKIEDA